MPKRKYKRIDLSKLHNPFYGRTHCSPPRAGYVYAVRFDGICKIGVSGYPPPRIEAAQVTMRRTYDEVHIFPADHMYQAESLLFKHFAEQRIQTSVGKEWFKLDESHMAYIHSIIRFQNGEFLTETTYHNER